MMDGFKDLLDSDQKITEESIFGNTASQFREMISWLKERQVFEIFAKLTGTWNDSKEFFKGKGKDDDTLSTVCIEIKIILQVLL